MRASGIFTFELKGIACSIVSFVVAAGDVLNHLFMRCWQGNLFEKLDAPQGWERISSSSSRTACLLFQNSIGNVKLTNIVEIGCFIKHVQLQIG